jgi:hypothetical protein
MVNESSYWKADLAREIKTLGRHLERYKAPKKRDPSPSDLLSYEIERFAFLTAFITRKLLDSVKLSQELESENIKLRAFPGRKRPYKRQEGEHEIMERFRFSSSRWVALSLRRLCDILIHSSDFHIAFTKERELFVSFNSDRTKTELYEMALPALIAVAGAVAADDVVYSHAVWDSKLGRRREIIRSRNHPRDEDVYRRP